MSTLLVNIKLADGTIVAGAVHGAGGLVAGPHGRERIERAIKQANRGRDTGFYEPKKGHARVYREASALSADDPVDVDLRGAELVSSVEFGPIRSTTKEQA